jgi:hypothetical protein
MATQVFQDGWQAVRHNVRFWRDTLVFVGGAEAFHTLSHVWLGFGGMLPMSVPVFPSVSVTLTPELNAFAVIVNGLITAGALYWAHRLKEHASEPVAQR